MAGLSGAFSESEDEAGRAKLAEMMAFLREAPDVCPESPVTDAGGIDVLALYMSLGDKAPSEDEIEAKQVYLQALLRKIGKAKWCQFARCRNGRGAGHRGNAGARGPVSALAKGIMRIMALWLGCSPKDQDIAA